MMSYATRRSFPLMACVTLAAALVVGAAPGCTVVTNTTAIQCTSESDCLSQGAEFANTTCDKVTRTCIRLPEDEGLCTTNAECMTRLNAPDAAICRKSDRKCVALKTAECPTVLTQPQQLQNDNAVVIGAMTPVGTVELGDIMEKAVELAQLDFSKTVRGLPSTDGSTEARPFVILACREFGSGLEGLVRAATHLTKTVQVPVVVGPVDPANAAITAGQVFMPNRTLSIMPSAITSQIASLPNPIAPTPLTWRINYDDRAIASVVSEFIPKVIEPRLRTGGLPEGEPLRIAIVREGNLLGQSAAARMREKLVFNGMSADQNAATTPPNLISVDFGDLNDTVGNPNPDGRISQTIAAVIAFKPHIVIHAYATFGIPRVLFPLDNLWPAETVRPVHIGLGPPWNAFAPMYPFLDAMPGRRNRVFSVQGRVTGLDKNPLTDPWVVHFKETFPEFLTSTTPQNPLVHLLYDSTFLAAYAIVANGSKPLTGENLAMTLPRFVPPGTKVSVRTDDISKTFGLLTTGQGVDLEGMTGNLDFDTTSGAPTYDLEMMCPDAPSGKATRMKPSGFYYTSSQSRGEGNIDGCQ